MVVVYLEKEEEAVVVVKAPTETQVVAVRVVETSHCCQLQVLAYLLICLIYF